MPFAKSGFLRCRLLAHRMSNLNHAISVIWLKAPGIVCGIHLCGNRGAASGYFELLEAKISSKKLWLTEWNVSAHRKEYISSQLANLYYTAYLLRLARYSAENNGFVTYAHHHNLLANGKFPIMRPDANNPVFFDKCERRPSFLTFAHLRDLFDGNTNWLDENVFYAFQIQKINPLVNHFCIRRRMVNKS